MARYLLCCEEIYVSSDNSYLLHVLFLVIEIVHLDSSPVQLIDQELNTLAHCRKRHTGEVRLSLCDNWLLPWYKWGSLGFILSSLRSVHGFSFLLNYQRLPFSSTITILP